VDISSKIARLRAVAGAGTRLRFERREQFVIVGLSHTAILFGVILIIGLNKPSIASDTPGQFWISEVVIIGFCIAAALSEILRDVFRKTVPPAVRDPLKRGLRALADRFGPGPLRERGGPPPDVPGFVGGVVLVIAFFLQFLALAGLLNHTGGPIDSPFAPLAIAIAIFTPLVANNPMTIVVVLLTTLVFYCVLVYGDDFDAINRPSKWAFVFVNAGVLFCSVIFSLFELLNRDADEIRIEQRGFGASPEVATDEGLSV
jgi:hypothetical protein